MQEFEVTHENSLANKKIKWNKVAWISIALLMFAIVLIPKMYIQLTWLMIPFVVLMFFYDDFYALWGMFLFFEENVVIIPGLSMFAIYSFLVIGKYVLFDKCEKKLPVFTLPAVFIMILYALFALPSADTTAARLSYINSGRVPPSDAMINMRLIIGYAFDSVLIIILALRVSNDEKLKKLVCKVIAVSAVLSGIFGYTANNLFIYGGEDAGIIRYMASFNDPNYASFFFNLAIFIVLIDTDFKKLYIKIPLLVVYYYFLVATGSLSGIIFNVIGLILFSVFRYRLKAIIAVAVTAVIAGGAVFAVMKIPKLANLPVVINLQNRLDLQFSNGEDTTAAEATSGRSEQWEKYWGYFKKQEIGNKLFGGNIIMSYSIDQHFKDEFDNAPHQAYISFLLDFGIIGGSIMILFFIAKLAATFILMCKENRDMPLLMFMIACMWLFYGFGFDYFGDWRFMIFYFL